MMLYIYSIFSAVHLLSPEFDLFPFEGVSAKGKRSIIARIPSNVAAIVINAE